MTRDTIRAEVFVKYVDAEPSNWNQALTDLMAAIANNTGGIVFEGLSYGTSTATFNASNLVNTSGSSGTAPRAFLNWIVFDRNFVPKDQGGFMRISTAAKETGSDVAHERLFSPDILITEPGYVYIYLSNEEEDPVEVFFDDFRVEHVKSLVVQVDNYYPGGATFNSYSRENSIANKRLYQTKELQTDLGLTQYDFGPRQYDPFIWRTTTQDRHAESYYTWSPYSWAFNNPIRYDDPTGNDPGDKVLGFAAALIDNAFGGMTNARGVAANYVDDPADFNMGQDMGDVSSMVVGVMMVEGGTGAAIGGGALSLSGVGAVVGAPVAGGGLLVAAEGVVLGISGAASFGSQKGRLNAEGKYSNLKEPRNVGDGKKTTPAQRQRILAENKNQNGGQMKSDGDGRPLNEPQKNQKGQKADMNQAEVDHVKPRSKGGSNSNSNQRVISKEENLKKGNREH